MHCSKRVQNFIELVANVMEAHTTALFTLLSEEDENLHLYGYHSFSRNIISNCCIAPGEGIVGWVFRERKPVVAMNFDRDTKTLKFYKKDEEIKSLIAVPLPDGRGVLCADSKKSYLFTEKNEKIFNQMAAIALSLIESDREREEKDFIERILDVSWQIDNLLLSGIKRDMLNHFFRIIAENLHISHIFMATSNEDVHSYMKEKSGYVIKEHPKEYFDLNGLLGWSYRNEKRIFIENFKNNEKTFVVNRNENLGKIHNFVAIPAGIDEKGDLWCCGLIKEGNIKWERKELDFLDIALRKIRHALAVFPAMSPPDEVKKKDQGD